MIAAAGAGSAACGSARIAPGPVDRPEFLDIEAGAADQRAIDVRRPRGSRRRCRLDRAAIEDAHRRRLPQTGPGGPTRMRPCISAIVRQGRRAAGADRPDRLVGDDQVAGRGRRVRQADPASWPADHRQRAGRRRAGPRSRRRTRSAIRPAGLRRHRLGADQSVGLAMAAGGARNGRRSRSGSRRRAASRRRCRRCARPWPRHGSPGRRAAIALPASSPATGASSVAGGQSRASQAADAAGSRARSARARAMPVGAQAVHLPVAGDQGNDVRVGHRPLDPRRKGRLFTTQAEPGQ